MIFTHMCRVLAAIAFVFGILQIVMGFTIASGDDASRQAALAAYSTASTTGEVIDKGFLSIVFAIALGTLAEISFSVRRGFEKD